jgi:hypothetical protein
VEADLYDSSGNFVGHSTWTGAASAAALQFEVAETNPPYTLENLTLIDAAGPLLDSRPVKAYTITDLGDLIDQGALSLSAGPPAGDVSGMAVTPTGAFTVTSVDANGNGRIDQIVVKVGVQVTETGGLYRVEGLLVDPQGKPVAWGVSEPTALEVGTRKLELPFDGRVISNNLPLSPASQPLKLVAVKIYRGNLSPATLEAQVAVAATTPAYTRDQFEKPVALRTIKVVFEDKMENGAGSWSAQAPWTLSTDAWYSSSHAWKADASGSQSGLLSMSTNISLYQDTILSFKTCYDMGSANDVGYVEASTNGTSWTRVATYNSSTPHWSTQLLDLSQFAPATSLQLRFNASSQNDLLWYIDDVTLYGTSDADKDGLSDDEEAQLGTNPNDPDTDNDGLLDGEEVNTYHTKPRDADTDDDGMPDGWEVDHGLDPLVGDGNGDLDRDGLTNRDEYNRGTDPANADTDNDGMPDKWEVDKRLNPVVADGNADPDGDALKNVDEYTRGTNPQDPDTDDDTLKDGREVTIGTNPKNPDSDGDGIPDGVEVGNGSTPTNTDGDDKIDALDTDSDGDGILDATEWDVDENKSGADNLCANLGLDTDGDGIPNCQDNDADGDGKPNYRDTNADGDGSSDKQEGVADSDGDGVPNYLDSDPSFNEWVFNNYLPFIRK